MTQGASGWRERRQERLAPKDAAREARKQQRAEGLDTMPWTLAVGIAFLVIAAVVFLVGGGGPGVLVLGFVGLMLLCTGLIQRTIIQVGRHLRPGA